MCFVKETANFLKSKNKLVNFGFLKQFCLRFECFRSASFKFHSIDAQCIAQELVLLLKSVHSFSLRNSCQQRDLVGCNTVCGDDNRAFKLCSEYIVF